MDALSEVLSTVRMTGAIFFNAEFTAPWGFTEADRDTMAHVLAPGTERLVPFHLVTEGEAVARTQGMPELRLAAGDIVIVPRGDRHSLSRGSPTRLLDGRRWLEEIFSGDLGVTRGGGGGAATRFVCGYFGCERQADRTFLAGLPPMIKVNIRSDAAGAWLETSIRHLVCEACSRRPGGTALLSKMAEALFVEALRRYMEELPTEQTGWLAGARDPVAGAVLALLHRLPCHQWTLEKLAAEVGASRSVVAERFARCLGEPPLTYLARWRMQLAARQLRASRKTILQLASEVGYVSEAAFNRAFKREFGLPPARYRRRFAENGGQLPPEGRSLRS
jgi:AraC-like DNA-binding protein